MFSVVELPELDNGGKGNKLIEIPKAKLTQGERVAGVAVVAEGKGEVTLYAGARKLDPEVVGSGRIQRHRAQRGGACRAVSSAWNDRDERLKGQIPLNPKFPTLLSERRRLW
jgi:hypothetical protein